VSALFGPGDEARKTLIQAWLDEGINRMGRREDNQDAEKVKGSVSVKDSFRDRLKWNEPVLHHLPEVCPTRTASCED
jgi:ubiquinone biosynthesis protein COQ9